MLIDGGFGGGSMCSPGSTQPCYDGLAGTEDAGTCHAGTQTCAADGTSWGACGGEVTPPPRTCANAPGVSCDGIDCVLWAIGLVGGDVSALAPSPDGSVVIAGNAAAPMQLGKMTLPMGSFIAKINPDGTAAWANPTFANVLAVDSSGNVLCAGTTGTTIQIGKTTIPVSQYVLKLAPSGGVLWARSIAGSSGNASMNIYGGPTSIASSPDGDVLLGGVFTQTSVNFGDGPVPLLGGGATAYVAKLSGKDGSGKMATAGAQWTQTFPPALHGYTWLGPFVGAAASGHVSVLMNFGGGSVVVAGHTLNGGGGADIGLVTFSSAGGLEGTQAFGDDKDQLVLGATVGADGTVVFTGNFLGTIDPGGGQPILTSTSKPPSGSIIKTEYYGDGFVIARSQFNNSVRLAKGFGTAGIATGAGLDPNGGVVVTGSFTGVANLGGTSLDAAQGTAVLLAKFKSDGSLLWNRAFSHPQEDGLWPYLAVVADGSSWLSGHTDMWPLDFGSGPITSAAMPSAGFLAHFAP
jgi:hypothetical protein